MFRSELALTVGRTRAVPTYRYGRSGSPHGSAVGAYLPAARLMKLVASRRHMSASLQYRASQCEAPLCGRTGDATAGN